MEAAVEVALPSAVAVARLMTSPEGGFGSGGVVLGEVGCHTEGVRSSGGRKDDIHAVNLSAPSFWRKIPDDEHCVEVSQLSCLHEDGTPNVSNSGNKKSNSPRLDMDAKLLVQKSGKIERKTSGCTKRSRMAQMETSKSTPGSHGVNGISPELVASTYESCNTSEKNQLINQKNSSTGKRGDKRNSKVKHKNRCDSFSLKNGLVGFNSAAGGNNFFGMYGLKADAFDITKYVNELSLNELLHGSYTCLCIAEDKGKKAASSNNDLLQSVRNAWSILKARKILQAENYDEIDNSCIQRVSIPANSAIDQTDIGKRDIGNSVLPSSHQVQRSDVKIEMSSLSNSPLYTPNNILDRLALPPPKDLDLLLSDASKNASSYKSSNDFRLSKLVPPRTGLPPFAWSHSFSGHSKLGSDAAKTSTSRTTCQGRWVKVKNPIPLQKGSADLLVDFESLAFNQSLVPSFNLMPEHRENKIAPDDRVLSISGACSTSKAPSDEHSATHTAAQTLLDMAVWSEENPRAAVKLVKKPSQMTMKASRLKTIKRSDLFDVPNSSIRPTIFSKVGDYGFPPKKLRLSTEVPNAHVGRTEPMTKGKLHQSTLLSIKSSPRKLSRNSNASTDGCGTNVVKKCAMKTPRSSGMPGSSTKQKFWKLSQ